MKQEIFLQRKHEIRMEHTEGLGMMAVSYTHLTLPTNREV